MDSAPKFGLENELDLRQVVTTGSVLHIMHDCNEVDTYTEPSREKNVSIIGSPIESFVEFEKNMVSVTEDGLVKKKIIEKGGGLPLHDGCTVSIAFSGYFEKDEECIDSQKSDKPLEVDLNNNGLLPGLLIAVKSMLVGELSAFLLSYKLMYGEMGVPPRIKPKADCVFYIRLIRSILTPQEGKINLSEPNTFKRVYNEVKMLYSSGVVLYKSNNFTAAINLFRKGEYMLHGCRLANEDEEKKQERLLIKLYTNLMICYNSIKSPLKACTAFNELKRLCNVWNNCKLLYNNAKSLRMIGQFDIAEKRLLNARNLCPNSDEIKDEMILLQKAKKSCNQKKILDCDDNFKEEVDTLIKNFKDSTDLCKITLPTGLDIDKIEYIKKACIRENLFFNSTAKTYDSDKHTVRSSSVLEKNGISSNSMLDKKNIESETIIDI